MWQSFYTAKSGWFQSRSLSCATNALLSPFWGQSCPSNLHNKMWGGKLRIPKGWSKLALNSYAGAVEQIISAGCWRLCSNMWCKWPAAVAECFAGSVYFFLEQSRSVVDHLKWQSYSEVEFLTDGSWSSEPRTAELPTVLSPLQTGNLQRFIAKHKTEFGALLFAETCSSWS